MPITPVVEKNAALGAPNRPWEDILFRDRLGQTRSVRDIEGGAGLPDQPFTVDAAGDVVLDPDRILSPGTNPSPAHDYPGYMSQSYVGGDEPGLGANVLENGYSRIWMDLNGTVYLLARIANQYFRVELNNDVP